MNPVEAEIRNHLLNGGVEWKSLSAFFEDLDQSCVDGRDEEHVIGTPGGDMGALLLTITAAEKVLNRTYSTQEIAEIFNKYIERFGLFYMHTDTHGIEHILAKVQAEHADLFSVTTEEEMITIVKQPQTDVQKEVLKKLLTDSHNMGCGHLRLALQNAEQYQIRPEVLETLVGVYYEKMWSGEAVDFVVLKGSHAEKLVLNVHVNGSLREDTLVPAVQPLNPNTQGEAADEFFINHPEVVEAIAQHNSIVILGEEMIPGLTPLALGDFLTEVKTLGTTQLLATVGHLASHLEIWDAWVEQDENGNTVVTDVKKAA